jgi:hypothetical protein
MASETIRQHIEEGPDDKGASIKGGHKLSMHSTSALSSLAEIYVEGCYHSDGSHPSKADAEEMGMPFASEHFLRALKEGPKSSVTSQMSQPYNLPVADGGDSVMDHLKDQSREGAEEQWSAMDRAAKTFFKRESIDGAPTSIGTEA